MKKYTLVFHYECGKNTKVEFTISDPFSFDWDWKMPLNLSWANAGKRILIDLAKVTSCEIDVKEVL